LIRVKKEIVVDKGMIEKRRSIAKMENIQIENIIKAKEELKKAIKV